MTRAEEAQGRLAERQLAALDKDVERAGKADVRVRLQPSGNAHRFVIENYGPADATGVQMSVVPARGQHSPIPRSEMEKLPIDLLSAGDSQSLMVALTMATGGMFDVTLLWMNADSSPGQRKQQVSV